MTDTKTMLSDGRVLQAIEALHDTIAAVLNEKGATLRLVGIAVHHSGANNVMLMGCPCQRCRDELYHGFRKVANGRKPEAVHELPAKAVH